MISWFSRCERQVRQPGFGDKTKGFDQQWRRRSRKSGWMSLERTEFEGASTGGRELTYRAKADRGVDRRKQRDVDMGFTLGVAFFAFETFDVAYQITVVERHVADGRHAASRRGPGRLREALLIFLTAAVNLGIDRPRENPAALEFLAVARGRRRPLPDKRNSAVGDGNPAIFFNFIKANDVTLKNEIKIAHGKSFRYAMKKIAYSPMIIRTSTIV